MEIVSKKMPGSFDPGLVGWLPGKMGRLREVREAKLF
jgi:hypothetical protein